MRETVIVFDFDKTLTYKDSLIEIFKSEMTGLKALYRPLYFMIRTFAKFHVISRTFEKECLIKYLFNSDVKYFYEACRNYADKRDVNPIFDLFLSKINNSSRIIVLSASAQYYLEYFFRDVNNVEIIGTTFIIDNGHIKKIDRHPSGENKRKILEQMGITSIAECYYDSPTDECLLPLSRKYFKINNGKIVKTND